MKKIKLTALFIISIFILSSCSIMGGNMSIWNENNEEIADNTFEELINAIEQNDSLKIEVMFSDAIRNEKNLEEESLKLLEFIKGDIVSYSSAFELGVRSSIKAEHGKKQKEIQSSFCIDTSQSQYYIAIKECTRDDFSNSNIGLLSLYIIEAKNWSEEYVYCGDGEWTYGINIVDNM